MTDISSERIAQVLQNWSHVGLESDWGLYGGIRDASWGEEWEAWLLGSDSCK